MRNCKRCGGTGREPDHRAIGNELRKIRQAAGVSATRIAERMKITKAYLSDLELGRRQWRADLVQKYQGALEKEH